MAEERVSESVIRQRKPRRSVDVAMTRTGALECFACPRCGKEVKASSSLWSSAIPEYAGRAPRRQAQRARDNALLCAACWPSSGFRADAWTRLVPPAQLVGAEADAVLCVVQAAGRRVKVRRSVDPATAAALAAVVDVFGPCEVVSLGGDA